jgi:hypothetical protein
MADNDRILMGQNDAGETGFWVSKPGSDVSTVVASKTSTTTHWYKYQEEFDWTGAGGSSYATTDPGGSSFVSNGAGSKRTSASPGADGGSILYFGNGSPSYIETSLDGTEQFLGSTYTVVEMRIRANTSATGLPASSENDLKLTWDAFPLGEASPVNFHAGNLTGNRLSAGFGREKIHGNTWGKTFLDDGWIVLEWDMSGVQAWTDPNAYMQSLDGGANLHPPSIHYRINKLKFELTENDYTGTIDPLWEIDYVRVKKAGVGPSAGRQSQSFVKELAYDFDATHSAMVHQTGTVVCGVNLAWRDGKTSNRRGNDITVDHGVEGKGEIDIIPPLPYIPVIIFQRVETEAYSDTSIPDNETVSGPFIKDSSSYPGGEIDFSYMVLDSHYYTERSAGLFGTQEIEVYGGSKAAEIRTFAYLRAQKDKFWITCRNAIAADGYEPMLNFSTSERISDHEFGSDGPINSGADTGSTLDLELAHPEKLRDYWRKPAWEVPQGTVGSSVGTPNAWGYSYGIEGDAFGYAAGRPTQYQPKPPFSYFAPDDQRDASQVNAGSLISKGSDTFNTILKFKSGYGSWGQFPIWALRNTNSADGLGGGQGYQDNSILTWGTVVPNAAALDKQGYDTSAVTGLWNNWDYDARGLSSPQYWIDLNNDPTWPQPGGQNRQGPGGTAHGKWYHWTWVPSQGAASCWDSFEDVPALLPNYVLATKETPQIAPGYVNWFDGTDGVSRNISSETAGFSGTETWVDHLNNNAARRTKWQTTGYNRAVNANYDAPNGIAGSGGFLIRIPGDNEDVAGGSIGRTYEPEFFGATWSKYGAGAQPTPARVSYSWILPPRSTGVHHPYGTVPHRIWDLKNSNSNFPQPSWAFNSVTDDPDHYDFRTPHIRNKDTVTNQTSFIGGCPNRAPAATSGTTAYSESEVTPPTYRYYVLTIPAN